MTRPDSTPPASRARRLGRDEPVALPSRFYTSVEVGTSPDGHTILLDGRPVRTPRKALLAAPSRRLADGLAAEWQSQVERIDPASMPLTRLCNSAIDVVAPNADTLRADVVAFAMSDLLCYRAEGPADLVARQAEAWDPILRWAARALDATFITTAGIIHVQQPESTRPAIEAAVATVSPWRLAGVHLVTTLTGSAILALAVEARALTGEDAWRAAHVDEDYQIEAWGEDSEAAERRRIRWLDMAAAVTLLDDVSR